MAIEKVLIKIQTQITDLVNNLEDFVQPNVQPSSQECEQLKFQLAHLQDLLAVYTHLKHDKELSPSFNIHSKVSNTAPDVNLTEQPDSKIKEPGKQEEVEVKPIEKEVESVEKTNEPKALQTNSVSGIKLTLGINDKFRVINELFKQNANEYNIAMEQFNSISTHQDAETFMASLAELYGWNEKSDTVKFFYTLVRSKFK
jgi:hypothetical protein